MVDERLAIDGGTPVRDSFLPFHRPSLGPEEEAEILDTLRSRWLTTGPKTYRFEAAFVRYVGARHALGVTSCTAAMHLGLVALDIGPGDEVITSPITFPATANVVVHVGATPVFADVEPGTLNVDVDQIEARLTPRTRAIMPIHFGGHPCEMDALMRVARRHGLAVIEDCAHTIEATLRGRRVGSWGDIGSAALPRAVPRHGRPGGRGHDRGRPQGHPPIPAASPVSIGSDGSAAHSESDAS